MTQTLKPTTADEYAAMPEKELEGEPYEMPSGAVWLIAVADMQGLALSGELPMGLTSAALGEKGKEQVAAEVDVEAEPEGGKVDAQLHFARETTREHVLVPKLDYGGPRGALGVVDSKGVWHRLKRGDLQFAWKVINGTEGQDNLEPFRNRAERRALAAQHRRGKVQPRPVGAEDKGQSATT